MSRHVTTATDYNYKAKSFIQHTFRGKQSVATTCHGTSQKQKVAVTALAAKMGEAAHVIFQSDALPELAIWAKAWRLVQSLVHHSRLEQH